MMRSVEIATTTGVGRGEATLQVPRRKMQQQLQLLKLTQEEFFSVGAPDPVVEEAPAKTAPGVYNPATQEEGSAPLASNEQVDECALLITSFNCERFGCGWVPMFAGASMHEGTCMSAINAEAAKGNGPKYDPNAIGAFGVPDFNAPDYGGGGGYGSYTPPYDPTTGYGSTGGYGSGSPAMDYGAAPMPSTGGYSAGGSGGPPMPSTGGYSAGGSGGPPMPSTGGYSAGGSGGGPPPVMGATGYGTGGTPGGDTGGYSGGGGAGGMPPTPTGAYSGGGGVGGMPSTPTGAYSGGGGATGAYSGGGGGGSMDHYVPHYN